MAHMDLNAKTVMATDLLLAHLEWLREEGVHRVDADPATLQALRRPVPVAPPAPAAANTPAGSGGGAAPTGGADPLAEIAARIARCTRCPLHASRTRTVPGQGNPRPELLLVGEGPGREEDAQGLAFVGRSGELLTRLLKALGFAREEVFIANIVKCRPTENLAGEKDRAPTPEETAACLPYLKEQIAALRPKAIVALGGSALRGLLGLDQISKRRGQWLEYEGIPLMPTYHPSYLLRGGGDEKGRYWDVWEDMLLVLQRLGRRPPQEKRRPAARAPQADVGNE